jgi:uncharacterized protein
MKILLFLVAVFALLWLLRGAQSRRAPPTGRSPGPAEPQPMLACAQCGVHLPRDEALTGRGGVFCSSAHRATFEQAHPDS